MGAAYSLDLRERVTAAVAGGATCRAAATQFSVSVATVVRWSQRARETGSPAALRVGGRRPFKLAGERDWLLARLAEKPDLTLRALVDELAARNVVVTLYAVWHYLDHAGLSFKKNTARRRARSTRCRPQTGAMEASPGQA